MAGFLDAPLNSWLHSADLEDRRIDLLLTTGPAKKVSVYVMEGESYHGAPVYAAILDFLFYRGISDATVTRGIAGFGADHQLHTSRLVDLADKMPIKVEFIESAEKVDEVLRNSQT